MPVQGAVPATFISRSARSSFAASRFDIASDLRLEFADRGKFLFVTHLFSKDHFQLLAVKISVEVEQVDFDVQRRIAVLQGGASADIQHRPESASSSDGVRRVNALRRQYESGDVQVGGRKAELVTDLISVLDGSCDRVRASEHLTGELEFSCLDRLTNAGAADGFYILRNCGDRNDGESEFDTKFLEQVNVAGSFVAESETGADADALELADVSSERDRKSVV